MKVMVTDAFPAATFVIVGFAGAPTDISDDDIDDIKPSPNAFTARILN